MCRNLALVLAAFRPIELVQVHWELGTAPQITIPNLAWIETSGRSFVDGGRRSGTRNLVWRGFGTGSSCAGNGSALSVRWVALQEQHTRRQRSRGVTREFSRICLRRSASGSRPGVGGRTTWVPDLLQFYYRAQGQRERSKAPPLDHLNQARQLWQKPQKMILLLENIM